jgi:hypothetical protein
MNPNFPSAEKSKRWRQGLLRQCNPFQVSENQRQVLMGKRHIVQLEEIEFTTSIPIRDCQLTPRFTYRRKANAVECT